MFNRFLPTIRFLGAQRFLALWICAIAALLLLDVAPIEAAESEERYAAILIDNISGEVLLARNADASRHPASLVKIMTLYILFEELEAGRLTMSSKLKASAGASRQPPAKAGLKPGQSIRVSEAIKLLVTKSANDVAVVVAENIAGSETKFVKRMMERARELGMRHTIFRNASGLPDRKQITTARDMAILAQRIMRDFPDYYDYFSIKYFTFRGRRYRNHNDLLFSYKGTDGIKTGYIRASGFNVALSVRRGKKHLLAVVMGGKTSKQRNDHAAALLDYGFPMASESSPTEKAAETPLTDRVADHPPTKRTSHDPDVGALRREFGGEGGY
jgi:D-alanyl-D-alanine carboxypeptidase